MRKIFAFLCALSFAAQFNLLSAQYAMKAWKNGSVTASIPTADLDSVTFSRIYYVINGHKFIDLGLPSGVLWAETNIGAETAADDGNYYAWGETATKSDYSWSTYKYGDASSLSSNLTKYNSTDGKTFLEISDDAASVNWGSSCRMPTKEDFDELLNSKNCTWTWTSMENSSGDSIKGYTVTSKKYGNSIFLPTSGCHYGDNLNGNGAYGDYWSSTLNTSNLGNAYYLCFSNNINIRRTKYNYRYIGSTVRPVADP